MSNMTLPALNEEDFKKEMERMRAVMEGIFGKDTPKNEALARLEYDGDAIRLPKGMTPEWAIQQLTAIIQHNKTRVNLYYEFDAYPLDGAKALMDVLNETYGYARLAEGDFFSSPPTLLRVPVGPGKYEMIPWGRVSMPKMDTVELSTSFQMDPPMFILKGSCTLGDKPEIERICDLLRRRLKEGSVYKNKAIRMNWGYVREGRQFNIVADSPQFMDLSHVKEDELVLPELVQNTVDTALFTPITQAQYCRKAKIPLKRGYLFEGPYGVGKTLTAYVTAKKAVDHGWTFIYLDDARDLAQAVAFAKMYQPAIIFAEDIDRAVTGERSISMDHILNTIDGIDSKNSEIMVILTTNEVKKIAQAFLRPGRLDTVISVTAPDVQAVIRLLRLYGRDLIPVEENLDEVGAVLEGTLPAGIREVVERAKLASIRHNQGILHNSVRAEDLLCAAHEMRTHLELLKEEKPKKHHPAEDFVNLIARRSYDVAINDGEPVSNGNGD